MVCKQCGKNKTGFQCGVCDDCFKTNEKNRIETALDAVKEPSDFKEWNSRDLSEAFWQHLGRYIEYPNQKSLSVIKNAFNWAAHSDRGLFNSFHHALKWCGITLWKESARNDLPKE